MIMVKGVAIHPLLSSHPPVISPGDSTNQSRVRSLGTANTKLEPYASIRLRPDVDGNLLLASGSGDRAAGSVLCGNLYTFVLGCIDRCAPGAIEGAGRRRVGRRLTAVTQDYCGRSYHDRGECPSPEVIGYSVSKPQ